MLWATLAVAATIDEPVRSGMKSPADAAVVIGIEDYAFIPDVPYARRDARSAYDTFVYTRGIPGDRVRLLDGGSREMILAAIDEGARLAGANGTLWVYFAGHGAADPSTGKRLLLGDDVRADLSTLSPRGVALEEVNRRVSAQGAHAVMILDTCYTGVGRSGDALVGGKRFVVPVSAGASGTDHLTLWTAASADQAAGADEADQHGLFSFYALGALRGWADGEISGDRDGKVTLEEAQAYANRALRTVQDRSQVPSVEGERVTAAITSGKLERGPELKAPMTATIAKPAAPAKAAPVSTSTSTGVPPDLLTARFKFAVESTAWVEHHYAPCGFSFKVPSDWKQTGGFTTDKRDPSTLQSVTWGPAADNIAVTAVCNGPAVVTMDEWLTATIPKMEKLGVQSQVYASGKGRLLGSDARWFQLVMTWREGTLPQWWYYLLMKRGNSALTLGFGGTEANIDELAPTLRAVLDTVQFD